MVSDEGGDAGSILSVVKVAKDNLRGIDFGLELPAKGNVQAFVYSS